MAIAKNFEFYLTETWIMDISCFNANNKPLDLGRSDRQRFKFRIIDGIPCLP